MKVYQNFRLKYHDLLRYCSWIFNFSKLTLAVHWLICGFWSKKTRQYIQRVLNDLQMAMLSRRRMIWLLPRPFPTTSPVSQLARRIQENLTTGEGGVGGKEPNNTTRKPGWSSINHLQTFLNFRFLRTFHRRLPSNIIHFFEYYFNLF